MLRASRLRRDASLRGLGFFGLEKTASEQELRDAYFAVAKRLHPDVAGDVRSDDFKQAQEEYEHAKYELQRRDGTLRETPEGFAPYYRGPTGDYWRGKHGQSWKESAQNPYGSDMNPSIDPRVQMRARVIALGVMVSFAFIVVELFSASCGQRISYKPFWLSAKGSWSRRFEPDFGHDNMMKDYDAESALKKAGKLAPPPVQEMKQLEVSSFYAERISKLRYSNTKPKEKQKKSSENSGAQDSKSRITEIKANLRKAAEAANAAAAARRAAPGTAQAPCPEEDVLRDVMTKTVGAPSREPKKPASTRERASEAATTYKV
jgi:curved DNA-binding protein CbpA